LAKRSELKGNVMNQFSEYEWHEFPWDEVPQMLPGPHKRLKIYADANIPRTVIDELMAVGLPVESAIKTGYSTHPDENIYQKAKKSNKVLLTMDRHFWNDKNYPLQKGGGIIFIDISPHQPGKAIDGLARFYFLFAKSYPLDWWENMKVRVKEHGLIIRYLTREGRISEEEFRLTDDGKLLTRRLR